MPSINARVQSRHILLTGLVCVASWSCHSPQKSQVSSESNLRGKKVTEMPSVPVDTAVPVQKCRKFPIADLRVPSLIMRGDNPFFITRLTRPCVTQDGERGFASDSGWTAMGIPCTGGKGEITLSGTNYKPLKVAFSMATACPSLPQSADQVEKRGRSLGFGEETKLISFNPMAVQYWEIQTTNDQDIGDKLELRNESKLIDFWADFRANKITLPVKVYGRENAWVQDNAVFEILGELKFEIPMSFRFLVKSGRVLREDEITALRTKCEAIKPSRNCSDF